MARKGEAGVGELGHGLLDGWLAVRASRPGGDVGQAWPAIAGECWAKQAVRVRTRAGRQVGELGRLRCLSWAKRRGGSAGPAERVEWAGLTWHLGPKWLSCFPPLF